MKFLDLTGISILWTKIKEQIKVNVTDKLGAVNGIATLNANKKLTDSQLPDLKTINGTTIVGSGDITIDLSLYKIVEALPTSEIDINKIYLVINSNAPEGNEYSEYIYTNNKWELLGQYKADIDLTPYAKIEYVENCVEDISLATDSTELTLNILRLNGANLNRIILSGADSSNAGVMSANDKSKLDNIATAATADSAITESELLAVLV